ncbi:monoacylglycerol lipase ABHD6-like isoform X2 [Phoenix dactylifera]|uniref:Monoacylglycerol lipase ABHD6-like isoform X2 n=1 Tax=Phoenix dactylifera TaxID=42345 RepID=A0A8B8JB46_PHODC|nr:monoacylglycerol lipase ABHD6-like isoform X2 [Phoenix dactylifera]
MVNWVEAQKPLLHFLVKKAGLRQQTVEIEPGTVMSFWVPKEKYDKKKNPSKEVVVPEGRSNESHFNTNGDKKKDKKKGEKKEKPAVVLVHGFAAEGIVTWQFQVGSLTSQYAVYVPDLLFFGGSATGSADRSPEFQAQCLLAALGRLGVERFTAVGFSYGGMVAFKMAEMRPDLVHSLVVSGSVVTMTDSISGETLNRLGFSSSAELLLPESVKGLKALLSVATHKKLWFPDRLHKDYLKVMFNNRKERKELLEGLLNSNKDAKVPVLSQRILLLWGEKDNIFNMDLARNAKEKQNQLQKPIATGGEGDAARHKESWPPCSPGEALCL